MLKQEIIIREILCQFIAGQKNQTQADLSRTLNISLGMTNKTLSRLEVIGSVKIGQRGFAVIDFKRILLYWATIRNIERDVVYSTRVNIPVHEIERSMPPGVFFTAYSGVKFSLMETAADYSEVWIYSPEDYVVEIQRRFKKNNLPRNLIVLKPDIRLQDNVARFFRSKNSVTVPQLYVDLWNIPNWYSKEFLNLMERRIGEERNGILE